MIGLRVPIAVGALASVPGVAADRAMTVTDFDRLRVDGAFRVEVMAGRATSALISGTGDAVAATIVDVQGRTLTIRRNRVNWTGGSTQTAQPATIRITVPALTSVGVSGAATVIIDRMAGMRVSVSQEGTGKLSVAKLTADKLDVAVVGSGTVELSGKVAGMTAILRGAVALDAGKLTVADLKLTSENAGIAMLTAARSADVNATGSGSVTVLGKPACTVRNIGSGSVVCGASKQAEAR